MEPMTVNTGLQEPKRRMKKSSPRVTITSPPREDSRRPSNQSSPLNLPLVRPVNNCLKHPSRNSIVSASASESPKAINRRSGPSSPSYYARPPASPPSPSHYARSSVSSPSYYVRPAATPPPTSPRPQLQPKPYSPVNETWSTAPRTSRPSTTAPLPQVESNYTVCLPPPTLPPFARGKSYSGDIVSSNETSEKFSPVLIRHSTPNPVLPVLTSFESGSSLKSHSYQLYRSPSQPLLLYK